MRKKSLNVVEQWKEKPQFDETCKSYDETCKSWNCQFCLNVHEPGQKSWGEGEG